MNYFIELGITAGRWKCNQINVNPRISFFFSSGDNAS
jgi:hypothetical protein